MRACVMIFNKQKITNGEQGGNKKGEKMCFRSYSAFLFDAIFLSGGDNVGKNQG